MESYSSKPRPVSNLFGQMQAEAETMDFSREPVNEYDGFAAEAPETPSPPPEMLNFTNCSPESSPEYNRPSETWQQYAIRFPSASSPVCPGAPMKPCLQWKRRPAGSVLRPLHLEFQQSNMGVMAS
eukprot:TRINITY_DN2974_c0_g1_i1.p1 TRINITY_DN2974_c0_g1~~TRINITY_DN2974_c0_g1_i1.p1  ORF type:complete len:126 (+),score=19.61 TRINITY_DN2974_c0_g1_i1:258-635(+)